MALEDKLNRIDALNAQFKAAQPLPKERFDELWKKFRLEWNYNSNHIEGNTLTYGETVLLLIFGKTAGNHEVREYEEMQAHDAAIRMVETWANDHNRDLTEADIRTLNKVILVKPFWKEAITNDGQATRREIKIGDYKEFPNSVRLRTGELFHYASPQDTPRLMGELIEWYKINSEVLHPVVLASELHYKFIRIHPFDDGNGRVARLLVNYILMKNDYPPLIVKSKDKENYLTALQKTDSGDLPAFNEYMADQLIWSLEIANKAAKGENIEDPYDLDKEIELLKREISNIEEEDAQWVFDKETFFKIYDSWLSELIKSLITQIKKFNDLFVNPQHVVIIESNVHEGVRGELISKAFINENVNEIVDDLRSKVRDAFISSNTIIKINVSYGTFKKSAQKSPFGCRYQIEIAFSYLEYRIYLPEFRKDMLQPRITNELKEELKNNENIKEVFFDKSGNYFFSNDNAQENITPYVTISRRDILNAIIIMGGLRQFYEPRLLHKSVSSLEIEEISKNFGKTLFKHIDYCTKEAGLR